MERITKKLLESNFDILIFTNFLMGIEDNKHNSIKMGFTFDGPEKILELDL